jgi:hypothetical protein
MIHFCDRPDIEWLMVVYSSRASSVSQLFIEWIVSFEAGDCIYLHGDHPCSTLVYCCPLLNAENQVSKSHELIVRECPYFYHVRTLKLNFSP